MLSIVIQTYETVMGVIGIAIAPVWLFLIWLSLRSNVVWGWPTGPKRTDKPIVFWACMVAYFGLAVGYATYGFGRL